MYFLLLIISKGFWDAINKKLIFLIGSSLVSENDIRLYQLSLKFQMIFDACTWGWLFNILPQLSLWNLWPSNLNIEVHGWDFWPCIVSFTSCLAFDFGGKFLVMCCCSIVRHSSRIWVKSSAIFIVKLPVRSHYEQF